MRGYFLRRNSEAKFFIQKDRHKRKTEDGQKTKAINPFSNQSLSNLKKKMVEKKIINKGYGRTSIGCLVHSDHHIILLVFVYHIPVQNKPMKLY